MTRRAFFSLFAAPAESANVDDFAQKLLEHEKYYDPMVRKVFGCPTDWDSPLTTEYCHQSDREVDARLFNKARSAACRLYNLKEK